MSRVSSWVWCLCFGINMKCLFWNIRGIGKGEKIMSIRKMIGRHKISFLGLVETKHRRSINPRIRRMWGHDEHEFCEVYASEAFGGSLVVIWDPTTLRVTSKHCNERWILLEGCITDVNFECCIGVVYGPNNRVERNILFAELRNIITNINKPILLLGDFNVTLHSWERTGSFRCDLGTRDFSDWICNLSLIDIPLQGLKFTWRRNESKSKLDRALCCNEWFMKFPNLKLQGLKRSCSDHNPFLLELVDTYNWGPKPFRSYDAWFLNPNFKRFLCDEWQNLPSLPLHDKLKILKGPLKAWS